MVIAALICFVALVVAWLVAPDEPAGSTIDVHVELEEREASPLAA